MAGFTGREVLSHFDHPSAALLNLVREKPEQLAQRSIGERASQTLVFKQPFQIEGFYANNTITISKAGSELLQYIISQTRNAVMQPGHLPACFLAVLGAERSSMQAFIGPAQLFECSRQEFLVLKFLACAQGCEPVEAHIDAYRRRSFDLWLHIRHLNSDAGKPPIRRAADACAQDFAAKAQVLGHIDPAELGNPDAMIPKLEFIVLQAKRGFAALPAFEAWAAHFPAGFESIEKGGPGFAQVKKRLI